MHFGLLCLPIKLKLGGTAVDHVIVNSDFEEEEGLSAFANLAHYEEKGVKKGLKEGFCNKTIYQARLKLAKHCRITQAELWATYKAIIQIKDNLNKYKGNIKFLIDSKVVLHVLAKTENITLLGKEVIKVAQYLSTTRNIQFSWIPAHKGHKGNELADSLAKMAGTLKTQDTYTRLPKSTLKNSLNEWALLEWQENWNNSTTGRLCHQFIPSITNRIKANYYKPRSETTQCLTGHGNFMAYLYRFKKRNTNKCRCDNNSVGDAIHFIFHCERYEDQRIPFYMECIQGHNWPPTLQNIFDKKNLWKCFERFIESTRALLPDFYRKEKILENENKNRQDEQEDSEKSEK
ncbi:uncharacterized protein LOC111620510 [Centruroides sculpturatus]|uniref:uncharacterized protein LOC111620510 n=1 Tax=Centruroides sculpturatus TaxID=218467 RepID=UPI000C6E86DF|nr:uncharacterized protein LOC111620510 [Centruroides sculpturatus]